MADYAVSYAAHKTLTAGAADKVTFLSAKTVNVTNRGTGPLYVRPEFVGITAPAAAGDDTFVVQPGETRTFSSRTSMTEIRLVAAAAEPYSVETF